MKTIAAGLASSILLLAGCASIPSDRWTDADWSDWDRFKVDRFARATALAREGDEALAASNPERAVERYVLGLRTIGIGGSVGFDDRQVSGGFQVTNVVPESPADRAGMRAGDLVTKMHGNPVKGWGKARWVIAFVGTAGETIPLSLVRGGSAPLNVTLIARHSTSADPSEADEELIRSLRFKAAGATNRLKTSLPVPALAREHVLRAQTLARSSKTAEDFAAASREYQVATLLAPWWADAYINYALFQEATDDAIGARESLALYLEARPNAADRGAVSQKLASLSGQAEEQKRLKPWEGWWTEFADGRKKTTRHNFVRKGRIITAKDNEGFEYMRGTIVDEYTAQMVNKLKPTSPRCSRSAYNDVASTMRLSKDKRAITETMDNPIMNMQTCEVVRHNTTTIQLVR